MNFTDRLREASLLAGELEAGIRDLRLSEQATARPDPTDTVVLAIKRCYECMGPLVARQFNEYVGTPSDETSTELWCESCDIRWIAFVDASVVMLPEGIDGKDT